MNWRNTIGPLVLSMSVVASCSSTAEVDQSADNTKGSVPEWVRDGVELARQTAADERAAAAAADPGTAEAPAAGATLPDRVTVVNALTGSGLAEPQASCIYDALSSNPTVAADAVALIGGLSAGQGAASGAAAPGAGNASSLTPLADLTSDSSRRVLVAISPCIDQATLTQLLGASTLPSTGGTGSLEALIAGLTPEQLAALQSLDPAAIATAIGGSLTASQVQALQAALAAAKQAAAGAASPLGALAALNGIDLSKLDLSKLTPEQAPLLISAVLSGLTAAQRAQLNQLAGFDLDSIELEVDPSNLSAEELTNLLVLISPLFAASISPTGGKPPPGVDPTQIYIPPGTDLSQINPLVFLKREDAIAEFKRQGFSASVGECLLDGFVKIPPTVLAAFFAKDPNPVSVSQVLLTSLGCFIKG